MRLDNDENPRVPQEQGRELASLPPAMQRRSLPASISHSLYSLETPAHQSLHFSALARRTRQVNQVWQQIFRVWTAEAGDGIPAGDRVVALDLAGAIVADGDVVEIDLVTR